MTNNVLDKDASGGKEVSDFSGPSPSPSTPGPWQYVASNEHHGPYVTSNYGNTICDCYVMSNPTALSTRNGGDSRPIHHMADHADGNARLIAAAPDLYEALKEMLEVATDGYMDTPTIEQARAALAKARSK